MRMYKLSINNSEYDVVIKEVTNEEVVAEVNNELHTVSIRDIEDLTHSSTVELSKWQAPVAGPSAEKTVLSSPCQPVQAASAGTICAPIPGQIISGNVSDGDKVLRGQKVLVLEAMKLENVITSDREGMVEKVMVKEGDTVNQDQELLIVT